MEIFDAVKPTVLVVDDSPVNLSLVVNLLHEHYSVKAAKSGAMALKIIEEEVPDLVLLDVVMPVMTGYEVCRRIKQSSLTQHIPVIFLTSQTEVENEALGLELGAADYITRPIKPGILMSRVRAQLATVSNSRSMRVSNEYLEFEVGKRTRQLVALQDVTILALASLAETLDTDTGNHLKRTQHYVRSLARYLASNPRFSDFLTRDSIDMLYKCAPLHDIGKVGIPDRILLKPGKYTAQEFEIMKMHPTLGRDAIENAQLTAGEPLEFLEVAKELVFGHHEKWDGSGYPQGLAGDAIPVSARLMAVADVYDALISARVYKSGMPHEAAAKIIFDGSGKHFDPEVVDAFLALDSDFQSIALRFADTETQLQQKRDFMDTVF